MNTEIKNATIVSARLSFDDRGFLDCWLMLDYGGTGQGFGGYVLYLPKSFDHHEVKSVAGHHIFRCMEIAGVESWDKIVGRCIRARIIDGKISSIGHIIKNDWFCPEDDYRDLK